MWLPFASYLSCSLTAQRQIWTIPGQSHNKPICDKLKNAFSPKQVICYVDVSRFSQIRCFWTHVMLDFFPSMHCVELICLLLWPRATCMFMHFINAQFKRWFKSGVRAYFGQYIPSGWTKPPKIEPKATPKFICLQWECLQFYVAPLLILHNI